MIVENEPAVMAVKSSEIVRLLNSEKSNLRLGCSRWNRAVLATYDPISFSFEEQNQFFILDNENDSIRITNLFAFTIGEKDRETGESIPGAFDALRFYTFINAETNRPCICSSNLFYFEWALVQNLSPCDYGIKYKNYMTGQIELMETASGTLMIIYCKVLPTFEFRIKNLTANRGSDV